MFFVSTKGSSTPHSVKYIVLKRDPCCAALIFYLFTLERIQTDPSVSHHFLGSINVHHCYSIVAENTESVFCRYSETEQDLWGVLVRLII